jgi:hypothetical protein
MILYYIKNFDLSLTKSRIIEDINDNTFCFVELYYTILYNDIILYYTIPLLITNWLKNFGLSLAKSRIIEDINDNTFYMNYTILYYTMILYYTIQYLY